MSTPSAATPGESEPATVRRTPDQPAPPKHRPWAWIAACGVLALAVVGLGIWALSLHSDLDHQRDQTTAAQQEAEQASSQVDQLTQDVNDAIDQAGQAGADAKDKLQGALADLKNRLGELGGPSKPPAATATPTATVKVTNPIVTPTAAENATPGTGG